MATFGKIVALEDVTRQVRESSRRDMSHLQPYRDAIQALIDADLLKSAGIADVDPTEKKTERYNMRMAARKMGVAVRVRFQAEGTQMVYWIDPNAPPPMTPTERKAQRQANALALLGGTARDEGEGDALYSDDDDSDEGEVQDATAATNGKRGRSAAHAR